MPASDETRPDEENTNFARRRDTLSERSLTPQSPSFVDTFNIDASAFDLSGTAGGVYPNNLPVKFGNYTLQELIGEGGAGVVFKATSNSNSLEHQNIEPVAVKLIRPEIVGSPAAAARFLKEARLHAEVDSPYVTRHIESGCEHGRYFIVSEFVNGVGLDTIVDQFQTLPEKKSLRVIADVLKALAALHDAGVIHRDVKPGNIITCFGNASGPDTIVALDHFEVAKLVDFGLARHVEQSESLAMTRQQAILGTPLYMAPEQNYASRSVDARADIYSVGVSLYQMLTGKLPFTSEESTELAEKHRVERPRPLTLARKGVSEAVNNVVMKALEKTPALRYLDASEMLADVERLLNDQPISLRLYPETPDSSHPAVRNYDFGWVLDATPRQLWPLVSDTDRFNEAIGLPAPTFTYDHTGAERKIFAVTNFKGMKVRWREHPFQWIHEREMSVLREFQSGPFEWVTSTVELHALFGDKTRLVHRFEVKPRGLFGKLMTPFQFAFLTKRSLNDVYSKLETIANDSSCGYACDVPFSKPVRLTARQKQMLSDKTERLSVLISDRELATKLADLLGSVADPIAARLRPIPLSQKLKCTLARSLQASMRAVEVGLLNMSWDVICPVCRIATRNISSLERIQSHEHCEACNLDFQASFSKSVEVVFSVHPEIRPIELKTYCIGGPFHAPHVLAQNRLLPNQFVDIGVDLAPGNYQIGGPQIPNLVDLEVHDDADADRANHVIGHSTGKSLPNLQTGRSCIHIENRSGTEILARLEVSVSGDEAVTAALLGKHPLFQRLFPSESFDPSALIDVSNVYLLAIKHLNAEALIEKNGEVRVREFWTILQSNCLAHAKVELGNCEIVECSHDSVLMSCDALKDVVQLLRFVVENISSIGIPVRECAFAVNAGEVMIGSHDAQPSVFGKTIRQTQHWLSELEPEEIAIAHTLCGSIFEEELKASDWLINQFKMQEDLSCSPFAKFVRKFKSSG